MNRIKELRTSIGLTQAELGEKTGLNQTAIGKYEREQLEPTISTLKKLSSIFECSVGYILGLEDDFGNIEFTEAERALGLNDTHPVVLSDDDRYRLNILARAEDELGKPFVDGVIKMVELSIENKK
ncbi:MAG: helix-turn-helix transcriptional regulator [Clostridia bacterium]|nr:helix-turn-helix transcriptional regulator [Clostridia bacterium]